MELKCSLTETESITDNHEQTLQSHYRSHVYRHGVQVNHSTTPERDATERAQKQHNPGAGRDTATTKAMATDMGCKIWRPVVTILIGM